MSIFYMDGEFVDSEKAVLSVNDMAILRGYGIFDFMRTYNKKPFHLRDHIKRLVNSGSHVGLTLPCSEDELFDIVMKTVDKNDYPESNVRIVFTGGISPDSVTPQGNGKLVVMVTPKHALPDWWYTKGVKIITVEVERYIPEAKSTNYMNAVLAQQEAVRKEAIESVYVDRNGRILEGTTTNVFLFIDNKWVTPDKGILPGITRAVILDLMKGNYPVELRDLTRDDLARAEEIFISASNKEIVPVVQVDDLKIGSAKVGENTLKIMKLFRDFTAEYGMEKSRSQEKEVV